jgi:hypothetical protein
MMSKKSFQVIRMNLKSFLIKNQKEIVLASFKTEQKN